jgi:hypothetical protein
MFPTVKQQILGEAKDILKEYECECRAANGFVGRIYQPSAKRCGREKPRD